MTYDREQIVVFRFFAILVGIGLGIWFVLLVLTDWVDFCYQPNESSEERYGLVVSIHQLHRTSQRLTIQYSFVWTRHRSKESEFLFIRDTGSLLVLFYDQDGAEIAKTDYAFQTDPRFPEGKVRYHKGEITTEIPPKATTISIGINAVQTKKVRLPSSS